MALAVQEIAFTRQQIREEKEALFEQLEELATEAEVGARPRTREAAARTIQWAIDQGRAPRELRDYPWVLDLLAAGLLAHVHARAQGRHPFREIDRRMGWSGMDGLPRLMALPVQDDVPPQPRSMPPALRPENLRPLDTLWKLDGRFLRLGEFTGADLRRKGQHAYRLAISNERTYRLMDGLASQVSERQRTDEVLDDDETYRLAIEILGEEGAHAILGRRSTDDAAHGGALDELSNSAQEVR